MPLPYPGDFYPGDEYPSGDGYVALVNAVPTLSVEVAFDDDPFDLAPTWTDIADKVRSVSLRWGREEAFDDFEPGVCEVTLDNSDREFDPLYTSGTYYGKLLPNRTFRVQANYDSTDYPLYTGLVDGWPQSYQHPGSAMVNLTATDLFKLLAKVRTTGSLYSSLISQPSWGGTIVGYWPLTEERGGTATDMSGSGNHGNYTTDAGDGKADSVLLWESGSSQKLPPAGQPMLTLPASAGVSGEYWAIEAWVGGVDGSEGSGRYGGYIWRQGESNAGGSNFGYITDSVYVRISDGYISYRVTGGSGTGDYAQLTYPRQLDPRVVTHIVATRYLGLIGLWVNGEDVTAQCTSSGSWTLTSTAAAPPYIGRAIANNASDLMRVGHVSATIGSDLDGEPMVTDHYSLGSAPWGTEDVVSRAIQLWSVYYGNPWDPEAEYILQDSVGCKVGPHAETDASLLDQLRSLARTESGDLYLDHQVGASYLRFRTRANKGTDTRSTVSQATFSDDIAEDLHYSDLVLEYDDRLIRNSVTVNYQGGSVTERDATSVTTYGEQSVTIDTLIDTPETARNLALYWLDRYKDARLRVRSMTVRPSAMNGDAAAAMWPQALGRRVGDRVTVERSPQGVGSAISQELLIEGVQHVIEGPHWETTWWFSPAFDEPVWILGTGELDVSTVLTY